MTPGEIDFFSVDDYARQLLEEAFPEILWFAEVPPFTVAGPLEIQTAEALLGAEEKAANTAGMYGKVTEPWGGNIGGRALDTAISVILVENPEVNRKAPAGIGIKGKVMIRHIIATLLRQPGGAERGPGARGWPEFRLDEEAFTRLESEGGLLAYAVNFRINILLK